MKALIICVLISVLDISTFFSQNLITNYNVTIISSCPNNDGQLENAVGWINPSLGTPDLYNACSGLVGVPSNIMGFQNGILDSSYFGIATYSNQDPVFTLNVREYAQSELNSALNPCSIYELSFYVSLADSSHYGINSIGAFVGDSAIYRNDYNCFSYYEPQVNNPKTRMLSDKENWTKIEGKFVANGGEQYITIGNFDLDSEIDTFATNTFNLTKAYAYYYLDNVSLTLFADASVNAYAGDDVGIVLGDSVFIGQEINNLNCIWRKLDGTFLADSTSGIWVQPTEQTTYVVEQNLCGTITYDTVVVNIGNVGLSPLASSASANGVTISPNPNNGSFAIQNPSKQELNFELKNALGQVVYQEKIVGEKQKIELSLEKGIYFATFSSEKGRFEEKIVVY